MFKQKSPTSRLSFERLEDRSMLNGTVIASVTGGLLTLTGDSSNNALSVHQVGSSNGGANIQILGSATKIANAVSGKTGYSFTFKGITDITVNLNGGNDTLAVYSTAVTGGIAINMGAGNDALSMVNVAAANFGSVEIDEPVLTTSVRPFQAILPTVGIELGTGNDVASFVKVTATSGDFILDANDGRDVVTLNRVSAGTKGSGNVVGVEMGPGNYDSLAVVSCTADIGGFDDGVMFGSPGTNGVLTRAANHFFVADVNYGFAWVV
jgi:hypothetical protein